MTDHAARFSGTSAVHDKHRFDVAALERYLTARIEGFRGPLVVEQFRGGQSNPTFLLRAGDARYVLRKKPPGNLLPSAHAVDREYRVITALRDTGVPVPRTHLLCTDDSVIGTWFFVMEYVEGRIFWDYKFVDLPKAERRAYFEESCRVIAALHRVDYQAAGLDDYGRPGAYLERQIARWSRQYRASETQKIAAMDRLIEWLPANLPPGDETSVVHGDYHINNMIYHPTEPRVLAVLDWELSTLGHPLVDFAYHCLDWKLPPQMLGRLGGVDVTALGIPTEQEYVEMYCRLTGRERIEHFEYYQAFGLFRIAGVHQGIVKRAVDGNTASDRASEVARPVPLAEMGWEMVERLLAKRGHKA